MKFNNLWLGNKWIELAFILAPPFLSVFIVVLFKPYFIAADDVSLLAWILLVVGIDVSHVYSTLYKTYWDRESFTANRALFLGVPILCFGLGVIVHSASATLFWTCMAYLAVFHFVRQQYGFMRLYSRSESNSTFTNYIDVAIIYSATLYPIIYWHLSGDRVFKWFVEDDFFLLNKPQFIPYFSFLYYTILAVWLINLLYQLIKHEYFNLPKFLVQTGTLLSWHIGIITFNGDIIFTCLNVVAHGVPYMALIWLYGNKQAKAGRGLHYFAKPLGVFLFILTLLTLGYIEEGLWDGFIWSDHQHAFPIFSSLPNLRETDLVNFMVPLLSTPQITHYVLDAYIWKIKKPETLKYFRPSQDVQTN